MKLLANDTKTHRGLSNIKKETQEKQSDTDQQHGLRNEVGSSISTNAR